MVFLNKSGSFGFHERTQTSFLKWIRIQHDSSRSATLWPLDKEVLRNGSLPADVIAWMLFHSIDLTSVVPSPRSHFPGSGSDFSTTIKLATLSLSRLCCGNNLCRETIPLDPAEGSHRWDSSGRSCQLLPCQRVSAGDMILLFCQLNRGSAVKILCRLSNIIIIYGLCINCEETAWSESVSF